MPSQGIRVRGVENPQGSVAEPQGFADGFRRIKYEHNRNTGLTMYIEKEKAHGRYQLFSKAVTHRHHRANGAGKSTLFKHFNGYLNNKPARYL